jgi:hypothetical protein
MTLFRFGCSQQQTLPAISAIGEPKLACRPGAAKACRPPRLGDVEDRVGEPVDTAVRASRGKVVRAEPVAALYQQRRVHHIGTFPQLEDQMTNFTSDIDRAAAGYSPDRVDALVWAFSELLVEPMKSEGIFELYRRNAEAAEQRDKPQPTQTTWAIGSMEWLAEQKKFR